MSPPRQLLLDPRVEVGWASVSNLVMSSEHVLLFHLEGKHGKGEGFTTCYYEHGGNRYEPERMVIASPESRSWSSVRGIEGQRAGLVWREWKGGLVGNVVQAQNVWKEQI